MNNRRNLKTIDIPSHFVYAHLGLYSFGHGLALITGIYTKIKNTKQFENIDDIIVHKSSVNPELNLILTL
jgi:hypothetical protein